MDRKESKLRLPQELYAVLEDEAKRRGVSLNALVSTVLNEWVGSIKRLREALDRAREEGNGY